MEGLMHYTCHPKCKYVTGISGETRITKDYYHALLAGINEGFIIACVVSIYNKTFDTISYYKLG